MLFGLFYDANRNSALDKGEGLRGIQVFFFGPEATSPVGQLVTADTGSVRLQLSTASRRIVVPYLGIDMKLTNFPDKEVHNLWIPAVKLPDRVP
jgi:hypothetical protein